MSSPDSYSSNTTVVFFRSMSLIPRKNKIVVMFRTSCSGRYHLSFVFVKSRTLCFQNWSSYLKPSGWKLYFNATQWSFLKIHKDAIKNTLRIHVWWISSIGKVLALNFASNCLEQLLLAISSISSKWVQLKMPYAFEYKNLFRHRANMHLILNNL